MSESLYSEKDESDIWLNWGNNLALSRPELAEEIVRGIVEGEENGKENS